MLVPVERRAHVELLVQLEKMVALVPQEHVDHLDHLVYPVQLV